MNISHIVGFVLMDDLHASRLNGVCDSTESAPVDKHITRHIDVVVLVHVHAILVKDLSDPRLTNAAGRTQD